MKVEFRSRVRDGSRVRFRIGVGNGIGEIEHDGRAGGRVGGGGG